MSNTQNMDMTMCMNLMIKLFDDNGECYIITIPSMLVTSSADMMPSRSIGMNQIINEFDHLNCHIMI